MASVKNIGVGASNITPGSAKGRWELAHADIKATAVSATNTLSLNLSSDSNMYWMKVPVGVTRMFVRCKMAKTISAVGTAGKGIVIGAWITNDDTGISATGTIPTDSTVRFMRLDSATDNTTTTTFLPTIGSVGASTHFSDSNWYYAMPVDLTGYDLLGADFVAIAINQAAVTTGSGVAPIEILFLN